jgi:hypothetical protein
MLQAQLAKSQQSLPLAWPPPRGITRSHSRGEQHSAVTRAASAPAGGHAAAIGGWRYVAARQPALRQKKKARRREAFDTARALSAPAPPARAQRPRQTARALPRLLRSR